MQNAPRVDYVKISQNTEKLYQFWQPLGPIRSAPIYQNFVVNQKFDVNHSSFNGSQSNKIMYAHRMLGSEPTAWRAACQAIFRINGWDPSYCGGIETDGDGKFLKYVRPDSPTLDVSGITFPPATPRVVPDRITCTLNEKHNASVTKWLVTVDRVADGWYLTPGGGLENIVHPGYEVWLSLESQWDGTFRGHFNIAKYPYDVKEMNCVYQK